MYSQILIFRANINTFVSFAMIDTIESIETIEMPALQVFLDYSIVDLYLLIKSKSKNFSCSVNFLLRFIFNTANVIKKINNK